MGVTRLTTSTSNPGCLVYCVPAASTPFLELFVTLERTECEENKHIMEEPVGGAPLVAAVLFEEQGPEATLVRLRISYQLPGAKG